MGSRLLAARGNHWAFFCLHTVKIGGFFFLKSWSWLSHLQGGHSLGALRVDAKSDERDSGCLAAGLLYNSASSSCAKCPAQ